MEGEHNKKGDEKSRSRRTVRATVPGAVSVEPPTSVEPAASGDAEGSPRSRRTVPATGGVDTSVFEPPREPSGPGRSVSHPSATPSSSSLKSKSRRSKPATVPGAVAVEPSGPGRSVSLPVTGSSSASAKNNSKPRRTTSAMVPGAVSVEPEPNEPNGATASQRQMLAAAEEEAMRDYSQKGEARSSARASKPGAVSFQGNAEAVRELNLDPQSVKTLSEDLGYPLLYAQKGLLNGGGTIEGAVEWISVHENDPDINDPIPSDTMQEPESTATTTRSDIMGSLEVDVARRSVPSPSSRKKSSSTKKSMRKSGATVPGAVAVAGAAAGADPNSADSIRSSKSMRKSAKGADGGGMQVPASRSVRYASRRGTSSKEDGSSSSKLPGAKSVHGKDDVGRSKDDSERPRVLVEGDENEAEEDGIEQLPGAREVKGEERSKSGKNGVQPRLLDVDDDDNDDSVDDLEDGLVEKVKRSGSSRPVVSVGVNVGREQQSRQQPRDNRQSPEGVNPLNAAVQRFDEWNADRGDDRAKSTEDGKRKCKICVIVMILIVGVVVGVSVGVATGGGGSGSSDGNPSSTPAPSPLPTAKVDMSICFEATASGSFSSRYTTIRDILFTLSTGNVNLIDEPSSPQRKALCWLSDFDPLMLEADETNAPALLQRYTLAAFYYSVVDESVSIGLFGSNWLSGDHECFWEGVSCTLDTQPNTTTALNLRSQNLNGELPEEVVDLGSLEIFNLDANTLLTGTLPASFWTISSLREVVLHFTDVTGSIPSEIGKLSNLTKVLLQDFGGILPEEVFLLGNLVNFESEGAFEGTLPTLIGQITNIETFLIRITGSLGSIPSEIGQLGSLRLLQLSLSQFTGSSIPTEIGMLSSLENLQIEGCGLSGPIPSEIGLLENLELLALTQNPLTGTLPTTIGNLVRAETILLQLTMLGGTVPSEVCDLRDGALATLEADCDSEIVCPVMCCTKCVL